MKLLRTPRVKSCDPAEEKMASGGGGEEAFEKQVEIANYELVECIHVACM